MYEETEGKKLSHFEGSRRHAIILMFTRDKVLMTFKILLLLLLLIHSIIEIYASPHVTRVKIYLSPKLLMLKLNRGRKLFLFDKKEIDDFFPLTWKHKDFFSKKTSLFFTKKSSLFSK